MQFDIKAYDVEEDGSVVPKIRPRFITGFELALQRVVISFGSYRETDSLAPARGVPIGDFADETRARVALQWATEANAALLREHNRYYPDSAQVTGLIPGGVLKLEDRVVWIVRPLVGQQQGPLFFSKAPAG